MVLLATLADKQRVLIRVSRHLGNELQSWEILQWGMMKCIDSDRLCCRVLNGSGASSCVLFCKLQQMACDVLCCAEFKAGCSCCWCEADLARLPSLTEKKRRPLLQISAKTDLKLLCRWHTQLHSTAGATNYLDASVGKIGQQLQLSICSTQSGRFLGMRTFVSTMQLVASLAHVSRPNRIFTVLTKWSSRNPAALAACNGECRFMSARQPLSLLPCEEVLEVTRIDPSSSSLFTAPESSRLICWSSPAACESPANDEVADFEGFLGPFFLLNMVGQITRRPV